jgi:MoaA/NifB/PqqE/SkfB family radical SAM enzyme
MSQLNDRPGDGSLRLSQRGEIRLGFRCNARCGFCYYQDLLDNPKDKEPTTAQLKRQLQVLRDCGASEVEFTGGEPTIRNDLGELTRFAKALGFVNVSVITNGLRLGNAKYARSLVTAGVNDFLFSIHGHTAELHDQHTKIPGSFQKITQALANVQALGARCRSSTTITARNHAHTTQILGMLVGLRVESVHLAVFSPVAQAQSKDFGMAVRYTDAAESIKRAIDTHRHHLPLLSVKYIPFCLMRGYEQYVMNLYQQSFDPDDWNYYYSNKVRRADTRIKGLFFDALVLIGGLLAKDHTVVRRHGFDGWKVLGLTRIVELLRKQGVPGCRSCSYRLVCDRVWKAYVKRFGEAEFAPVPGPLIRHPAWSYELARSRAPGVALVGIPVVIEPRRATTVG